MIYEAVEEIVNTEVAASLCLSKGGWEGWLQCELWRYLTISKNVEAEREIAYPRGGARCDLKVKIDNVIYWVEIKAFGIFREGDEVKFLDSIGIDMLHLDYKPKNDNALSIVVVPKAIGEAFHDALKERGWNNYELHNLIFASVYTSRF